MTIFAIIWKGENYGANNKLFIYEQNGKEYFKIVKVVKIESQELLLFTQTGKM